MVSITGEQQKVMDEALRLGVIGVEREALEAGFAALRERVKQKNLELAAAEQAELDRIAANQFSLFGEESSGLLEAGPAVARTDAFPSSLPTEGSTETVKSKKKNPKQKPGDRQLPS